MHYQVFYNLVTRLKQGKSFNMESTAIHMFKLNFFMTLEAFDNTVPTYLVKSCGIYYLSVKD